MGISKVVFGDRTLVDLTGDSVRAENLLSGESAHGADGERVTGAVETYTGPTQIQAGSQAQRLSTGGKYLAQDIQVFASASDMEAAVYDPAGGRRQVAFQSSLEALKNNVRSAYEGLRLALGAGNLPGAQAILDQAILDLASLR